MWTDKRLPEVPGRTVDAEGREILEMGAHRRGMLVELEKAHIYIEQLNAGIKELEAKIERLEEKNKEN